MTYLDVPEYHDIMTGSLGHKNADGLQYRDTDFGEVLINPRVSPVLARLALGIHRDTTGLYREAVMALRPESSYDIPDTILYAILTNRGQSDIGFRFENLPQGVQQACKPGENIHSHMATQRMFFAHPRGGGIRAPDDRSERLATIWAPEDEPAFVHIVYERGEAPVVLFP